MKVIRKHKAFSLIELMVVIAIIALLAAVAVPAYSEYIGRANATSLVNIFSGIESRSREMHNTSGSYPASFADLGLSGTASDLDPALTSYSFGTQTSGTCSYYASNYAIDGAELNHDTAYQIVFYTYENNGEYITACFEGDTGDVDLGFFAACEGNIGTDGAAYTSALSGLSCN